MITSEDKLRYADVLLTVGVALKAGQPLFVEATGGQEAFVELLAQRAVHMGCPDVGLLWRNKLPDSERNAAGILSASAAAQALADDYAQRGAAYLRLDSPDLNALKALPPELLVLKGKEDARPREIFRNKAGGCGQTIACVPGEAWADAVFPELPQAQRPEALWEAVLQCTRCRTENPVAAWNTYLNETARRKEMLDSKGYTVFHYHDGHGTDLTICPAEGDFWKGSCVRSSSRVSVPNIPTEEVFLTPHKYKVNGTVRSTLPLNYNGELIEGIALRFSDGRIVRHSAARGAALLAAIIETDEGSHYLGEMALVSQSSPLARQGRVFYTTLFDENASCHFAVGNALGPVRDPDERERRGMNSSRLHVDFMIGSDDLCIDGLLPNGIWEPVFTLGRWAGEK